MKKTFIGISLLLTGLLAGTATAQTPATPQKKVAKTEQTCPNGECKKAERPCPFDQVTGLTADQKAKLQALAPKKDAKDKDAAKAEKQAKREEQKAKRDAARKEYLAGVKQILTPEQYVEFLEISFVNQGGPRKAGMQRDGHKGDKKGGPKMAKKGDMKLKGQRTERAAQSATPIQK